MKRNLRKNFISILLVLALLGVLPAFAESPEPTQAPVRSYTVTVIEEDQVPLSSFDDAQEMEGIPFYIPLLFLAAMLFSFGIVAYAAKKTRLREEELMELRLSHETVDLVRRKDL